MKTLVKLATLASAAVLLAGCGLFGGGRTEISEEERAARISLSVFDQMLEPDPALAATTVSLPAATQNADWPQAGRQPSKLVGNIDAGSNFRVAWRSNAGAGSGQKRRIVAAPVVSEGAIYVVDADQTVRAFDAANGRSQWETTLQSGQERDQIAVGAGIGVAGDRIIVTSGYGYVAALSRADGNEIWRRPVETPISGSPAILGGRAYVTSTNNELYVIDIATGELVWTDQAIAESARILASPSPAVNADLLVAPFSSGELIAYVPANGRRLWQDTLTSGGRSSPLSAINDISGRPTIEDGVVYAASHSGVLAAIDARTGTRIWNRLFGSRLGPVVSGQYLFIVGTDGQVACINKIDGRVIWVRKLAGFEDEEKKQDAIVWTGPLVSNDRLILVSSQGDALALSIQTGETIADLDLGQSVYIEPIAAGGLIYFLTDEGTLIAVR